MGFSIVVESSHDATVPLLTVTKSFCFVVLQNNPKSVINLEALREKLNEACISRIPFLENQ